MKNDNSWPYDPFFDYNADGKHDFWEEVDRLNAEQLRFERIHNYNKPADISYEDEDDFLDEDDDLALLDAEDEELSDEEDLFDIPDIELMDEWDLQMMSPEKAELFFAHLDVALLSEEDAKMLTASGIDIPYHIRSELDFLFGELSENAVDLDEMDELDIKMMSPEQEEWLFEHLDVKDISLENARKLIGSGILLPYGLEAELAAQFGDLLEEDDEEVWV